MRTLWLCLLIALVPLRLWAGSAMGAQHLEAPAAVHTEVSAAMQEHPCHGEASATPTAMDAAALESPNTHASCVACDICHTVAHPLGLGWGATPPPAQATPTHRPHAAISPQLARSVEPPIA